MKGAISEGCLLHRGDMRDVLPSLSTLAHACITDPPYGLRFMGKRWDYDVPSADMWRHVRNALTPGAHMLGFGGARTYHRMVTEVEDGGFEIRDQIMWLYGSGFPKGQYNLEPAHEPIVLARVPIVGSATKCIENNGTGGLNIDDCRVGDAGGSVSLTGPNYKNSVYGEGMGGCRSEPSDTMGRWPANVIHDGYPDPLAKFFYCAKASKRERDAGLEHLPEQQWHQWQTANGTSGEPSSLSANRNTQRRNMHPTVKPLALMRYLVRLVAPPGGLVLDPFMGSGTTGIAALLEGRQFVGIELEEDYFDIAKARITAAVGAEVAA